MPAARSTVVAFVAPATGIGAAQDLTAGGDAGHQCTTTANPAFGGRDAAPSPRFHALAPWSARWSGVAR